MILPTSESAPAIVDFSPFTGTVDVEVGTSMIIGCASDHHAGTHGLLIDPTMRVGHGPLDDRSSQGLFQQWGTKQACAVKKCLAYHDDYYPAALTGSPWMRWVSQPVSRRVCKPYRCRCIRLYSFWNFWIEWCTRVLSGRRSIGHCSFRCIARLRP